VRGGVNDDRTAELSRSVAVEDPEGRGGLEPEAPVPASGVQESVMVRGTWAPSRSTMRISTSWLAALAPLDPNVSQPLDGPA
jgi:hypothetical protein